MRKSERERGRERDMPDLSSEDDLGKYVRQDPNSVCGHSMARTPTFHKSWIWGCQTNNVGSCET